MPNLFKRPTRIRPLLTGAAMATSLALITPMTAMAIGFESEITAPLPSSLKIEVTLSEDLAHRANNLPKKLSDRNGSARLNSAFSQNGYYGDKDLARLTERLERKLTERLAKADITTSDTAATVLRLTLVDAKPNRPTFTQLSKDVSLSFQSVGLGGAEIEGELIRAGGESLGTLSYDWFENDIRDAQFGGVWQDANRAIDRFARKAATTLAAGAGS